MMLGDHEVVRLLGRGAMGSVHEVRHVATGARYAAKVMTAGTDARALERFRREAELLARCDSHPGIVHVHSFGTLEGGAPYMILDLVEGENLDALRQREGTLEPRRAATIIRDVASALGFMHERGIVHRDVKPANVLLDHQGRARLTDFGIASAVDLERLTRTGTFVGTFAYAAPEQLMTGDADEAADVFSLGCVLFELVAGRLPIDAETPTDHMRAVERGDLPARARALGIPRGLASVIARALAKDPRRRYADGTAMAAALDDFLAGRAPRGVDGRVRGAVALVAILIAAGVLVRHERTRGRAGAREVAGELATLARGRLGSDDVASLLLARAAVGIASESGGPEDPGCLETLARAALARGTDALAVAAATSALALAPERRADLLLLRARAKVGLRDEDGALADLVGLGSADAERMRVQALLVGRRTAELLALEGSDPFVVAARAVARCERDLATDDEQRRSAIFESARRELREAPPPFRALLADVRARAEIAAVASLVGARRDAVPPEFAINAATLREPDVLYRPLALAARELGHALESPAFLDPRTDLEALDVALAVIEAGPNSMRSNLEVGEESRGRRREVLELTLALEGIACRIAERPGDCLSHRVRTALTMVRLGGHDEPERRRFLEENVGKGPPLVDSYLRVVLLLCLEADCVAGRVGAREAAGTFAELVEGIDERIPMANNEVGFRADMELTLGELLVRATTEEPTVGAARLEEARRHIALGRAIVERAGQPVVPSRSMGRHVISAEMMLALAEGDREPARRALVEFGQFDGFTKDTAELLFKAELARRGGDLAAAERFLHEAGEIPGSVGFLPTSHWFDFDVAVAGQLLALARGDTRARERLEELETRRAHPALLPWIDKELRQVLAK